MNKKLINTFLNKLVTITLIDSPKTFTGILVDCSKNNISDEIYPPTNKGIWYGIIGEREKACFRAYHLKQIKLYE